MKRSVYVAVCALLIVVSLSFASPAGAAPPQLDQTASSSSSLTVGRIFDTSARGNFISFSDATNRAGSASTPITGFAFELPLSERTGWPVTKIFAESADSSRGIDASHLATTASAQAAGMQFDLLGGAEATVSWQSTGASFGGGPFIANPSQQPAVFAFYNFPQANERIGLGQAFGLRSPDAAFAASLNAPPAVSNTTATSLASPLISSLSAQGPFWFSAYSPATQGSSLSLTIPFRLARIPVKVRVGEQAISSVPTSSLATQILGPAFAVSAADNYRTLSGGVTLALPLLSRRATVSLDGWYETMQHNDKMPFNLVPYAAQSAATAGLGATPGTVVYSPNTDVQQYVGAASVALPVTSRLTVNGSFSAQVAGTVALDTLTQSLTQHKTAYGGGVGYNFPKTNSSIDLFFNKNVYTNDNVPNYNFTENRQNLYFSVKF
ncbi:MAG TPA: hypothetical protein VGW96_01980 [Candidatus Eremiobacteraceae bacterium]|nr:hypothetical protein [Candidatus Eremiobacteraceae bacterium]